MGGAAAEASQLHLLISHRHTQAHCQTAGLCFLIDRAKREILHVHRNTHASTCCLKKKIPKNIKINHHSSLIRVGKVQSEMRERAR